MTTPTSTQPNATTGSCSCTVAGDPHFTDYNATQLSLVPTNSLAEWNLFTDNGNTGRYQLLAFFFPFEGDVVGKRYSLGLGGVAFVSYQSVVPGEQLPYTPTSGELIVTVDVSQKKITGTYDLTAVNGARTVRLIGSFEVEGYGDEPKMRDSGRVNATITGATTLAYESTAVGLTDGLVGDFPNSIGATSEFIEGRPTPVQYFLSLRLAKNLALGKYPITPNSSQVRALFIDGNNGLDVFRGESGEVTLQEMPQTDPLAGRLKALFHFDALSDDKVRRVSVANGEMTIQK